ncbi:MAG TPA: hypothetical protein PK668_23910 [Myxococcota bacterium]|nr:hypothetical protein [Myxococcota bacterium]HRY96402.1 hypothetical protein [Myxococcota bacterium]
MATKTKKAKPKTSTIQGLVVAVDWNEDDDVPSQVAILTEADVEVLVDDTPEARPLLELEDAEVEAQGALDESDKENPVLRVSSFKVLSEPAAETDELEDELDDDLDDVLDDDLGDGYHDEYDEYDSPPRDPDDEPDPDRD